MSAAAARPFPDLDDPTPTTAWAYRHAARRLRSHFGHDRVALHRKLKSLALNVDSASPAVASRQTEPFDAPARPGTRVRKVASRLVVDRPAADGAEPDPTPTPVAASAPPVSHLPFDLSATAAAVRASRETVDRFAGLVVAALDEGVLRHSRRQVLLGQGMRLGLGLFEANLVIAAVQHRHQGTNGTSGSDATTASAGNASRSTFGTRTAVLAAVAVVAAELTVLAALVRWAM